MKKIILSVLFTLSVNTILAQSVFDKFDDQEGITAVVVNKKMFSLLSKMDVKDKESEQYVSLIRKLENLKVYVTQSSKKASDMKLVSDNYIKSAMLEELIKINEKDRVVKVYVKSGSTEDQIKEMLMFIDGQENKETVLMSLTGDFNLDELSILTDKMKLPGGADLKKAAKTNKSAK